MAAEHAPQTTDTVGEAPKVGVVGGAPEVGVVNRGFTARDYAFAALIVAALLVANGIAVPLVLGIQLPGIRNAVSAPLASLLLAVALVRLQRRGAVLLVYTPLALLYSAINPLIGSFVFAGAAFTELVCGLLLGGYRSRVVWLLTPLVYQLASFAAALGLSAFFMPAQLYRGAAWWLWVLMGTAIVALSLLGAWIGVRLARELIRAGRLRVDAIDP